MSVEITPKAVQGNNPGEICDDAFEVNFGDSPKCPGGWLIERPKFCATLSGVNDWEVQADCVDSGKKVKIHSSCSCPIGMCYTYPHDSALYVINGYQIKAEGNWYYDE